MYGTLDRRLPPIEHEAANDYVEGGHRNGEIEM